ALANGHRHSGASRQRLTVHRRGSAIALTVSDDGKGFDPQRVLASEADVGVEGGHFGLRGIQDRVAMLGGSFAIDSAPGRGTSLDAGADGLALKTESPQQTLTAIRQVHGGQLVFPQAARRWIEGRAAGAPGDLTPREREVWSLVAAGLTNPQIAERLGLSDNTVKFHVQHLFSKLGVKNRTEAALKSAHGPPPQVPLR